MATCSSSINGSYDSVEYFKDGFTLTDEMKKLCVETLHCSEKKHNELPPQNGIYNTWTSHWVRNKGVSFKVYTLLKVKRWHLIDENFIFDPLKKCKKKSELTASNTIWREKTSCEEAQLSVNGMLASNLYLEQFAALKKMDMMLETLDKAHKVETEIETARFFDELDNKISYTDDFAMFFDDLVDTLSHIVLRNVGGERVPEKMFEVLFQTLVQCLAMCLGGDRKRHVKVTNDVSGHTLEKIPLLIKLKKGRLRMEISSQPDLFMFYKKQRLVGELRTVLAVVEVKGTHKGKIVHSDDENEDDEPATPDSTDCESRVLRHPSLPTLEEGDEGDASDEDTDDETDLEKLITDTPEWLGSIRHLPYDALKKMKKFLPQLIGEMWCAARSKNMQRIKSKCGLLFGVGMVGFDIYFVSILDPVHNGSESVLNDDSPNINVFVTRPLNLLVKKDRRIIMKTLAASFSLHRVSLCEGKKKV